MHKCILVEIKIVAIPVTLYTACNKSRNNAGIKMRERWQYIPKVNI